MKEKKWNDTFFSDVRLALNVSGKTPLANEIFRLKPTKYL